MLSINAKMFLTPDTMEILPILQCIFLENIFIIVFFLIFLQIGLWNEKKMLIVIAMNIICKNVRWCWKHFLEELFAVGLKIQMTVETLCWSVTLVFCSFTVFSSSPETTQKNVLSEVKKSKPLARLYGGAKEQFFKVL